MNKEQKKQIKKELTLQLEKYINIFKLEFKEKIPNDILEFFTGITDYEELIKIENTGTITCYVKNRKIYFPILADKILNIIKVIPGFGNNPNHKAYQEDTLVINNNTFLDYMKHAFISGTNAKEFFLEMLLHEVMHLCGLAGGSAFEEGLTELKTRELAKKYNLKTSSCGYPKEVAIAYRLQRIFGKDLMDTIAFYMPPSKRRDIILKRLGPEEVELFDKIGNLMEQEFYTKYYKHKFNGLTGPIKKAKKYDEIDYTKVHRLIDEYCNKYGISENRSKQSVKK